MIRHCYKRFAFLSSVAASFVLSGDVFGITIFSVGGDNTPASIQGTVDSFRAALGNPNNGNAPGPLAGGRREINWDGGGPPVDANSPGGTPFDVFLNNRGARFTTPGTGFLQGPPSGGPDGGFEDFFNNSSLGEIFGVFSKNRIFSPVNSNITDVSFFIPGTNGSQPATVTGFGAIFTDVDLLGSASIELFDIHNNSIFSQNVSPGTVPKGSFSFLGIADAVEQIFRVRITSGNAPIGPKGGARGVDLVAMDDFFHAEPQRVSESGVGIGLIGLVLGFMLLSYRRSPAVS